MENKLNENIKEQSEKKSCFKMNLDSIKKIKPLDILLILAIILTIGIFSFIIINKVFFKEAKGNVVYYKLTFDSNDGSDASVLDVRKGYIDLPTNIHKEGYEFDGWVVNGKLVKGKYYVSENTVFEAQWKLIVDEQANQEQSKVVYHTVTFDLNGGGNTLTEQIVSGEKVIQPADPLREGYTFKGWYYKGIDYDFNSAIIEDTTIVAQWVKDEENLVYHTITFDLNGGGNKYTKKVSSGNKVAKPTNPIRTGYTFKGWTCDGKTYNFDGVVKKDITLVAQWSKNVVEITYHTITFDLNGGGSTFTNKVASGSKVTKPTNPTRTGYVFKGWSFNGQNYDFNNIVKSNIKLVAQWNKIYNVKFVLNNGKSVMQQVEAGNKVNKIESPERKAYLFRGWYTEKSVPYNFNNEVTDNVTLYAKWSPERDVYKVKSMVYIGVIKPATINNNRFLADENAGKKLLSKVEVNSNAEIYYSHLINGDIANKTYYAIRIYNESVSESVTIRVNKCGISTGNDSRSVWEQYYNNTCGISGKKYTIKPNMNIIIFHNKDNFVVRDKNDQSGVVPTNSIFEGVLNISTTGKISVSNLAFKNIADTYKATI